MTGSLPAAFHKILVIRRDNIGDLLCTTPLLSALRDKYPQAHIAVLANSYNAPVLEHNPDINRVYHYTKAKHSNDTRIVAWWKEWRLLRSLRQQKYDLVINANPTAHRRTGRLVRYLKAPYRLGVDDGHGTYNIAIDPQDIASGHHVEQVISLLRPLGITSSPGPMTLRANTNYHHDPEQTLIVGIHLSSRKPCNRWPLENYEALCHRLLADGFQIRLFWAPGSQHDPHHPGDDELAASLQQRLGSQIEAVATHTLSQLIDTINLVDLMVCPDGGALHIAIALGKPTVALFGCTDSRTWGPWLTPHHILEGHGQAENIDVTATYQALKTLQQTL